MTTFWISKQRVQTFADWLAANKDRDPGQFRSVLMNWPKTVTDTKRKGATARPPALTKC